MLKGCAVVVGLLVLGIALLFGVDWQRFGAAGEKGGGDEELELARALAGEFGARPDVELVCRLPVVGEAPCLPGERTGAREVTLTFSDHEPPAGVDPREHARRIAVAAHAASSFVREAAKIRVVFHQGDESASVLRRYSFGSGELTAGGAAAAN